MASRQSRRSQGFSLVELLVSIAVLTVVMGTAFGALNGFSRSYGSTMLKADMDSGARSAAESLTQEVAQAGSVPANPTQLAGAVVPSAVAQPVNISSTTGMFVGQNLLVDTGNSQELVTIKSIVSPTSITAIFGKPHNYPPGAPVDASGVFPEGILAASTPNQLMLIGDMNGDGTLSYVEYDCNPNAAGTGTLTRSITTLPAAAKNPPTLLLQNLVTNPGALGNACFTIPPVIVNAGFNFVPSVGLTLTTQSSTVDPQSGAFQTLTSSFMYLSPRNVLAGLDLVQSGLINRLQPTPLGVPLT